MATATKATAGQRTRKATIDPVTRIGSRVPDAFLTFYEKSLHPFYQAGFGSGPKMTLAPHGLEKPEDAYGQGLGGWEAKKENWKPFFSKPVAYATNTGNFALSILPPPNTFGTTFTRVLVGIPLLPTAWAVGGAAAAVTGTGNWVADRAQGGAGRVRSVITRKGLVRATDETPDIADFNRALQKYGLPATPGNLTSMTRAEVRTELNRFYIAVGRPKAGFGYNAGRSLSAKNRYVIASQEAQADRLFAQYIRNGKFSDNFHPTKLSKGLKTALAQRLQYATTVSAKNLQDIVEKCQDRALTNEGKTNAEMQWYSDCAEALLERMDDLRELRNDIVHDGRWDRNNRGARKRPTMNGMLQDWTNKGSGIALDGTPEVDRNAVVTRYAALDAIRVKADRPDIAKAAFDAAWHGVRAKTAWEQARARGEIADDRVFNQKLMEMNRYIDGCSEIGMAHLRRSHPDRRRMTSDAFIDDQIKKLKDVHDEVEASGRSTQEFLDDIEFGSNGNVPLLTVSEFATKLPTRSITDRLNSIRDTRVLDLPHNAPRKAKIIDVLTDIKTTMEAALIKDMEKGGAHFYDRTDPANPAMVVNGVRMGKQDEMKIAKDLKVLESAATLGYIQLHEFTELRSSILELVDAGPRAHKFAVGVQPPQPSVPTMAASI